MTRGPAACDTLASVRDGIDRAAGRAGLVLTLSLVVPAAADPLPGVWQTGPDGKDQVAHVVVERCTQAICGTIVRAFDAEGREITTPNVGKRVFWILHPVSEQRYEGRAYVPAHDRAYDGALLLSGNRLTVQGCLGPVCMSQDWRRVR